MNWDTVVCVLTRLRVAQPRNRSSIYGGGRKVYFIPALRPTPPPIPRLAGTLPSRLKLPCLYATTIAKNQCNYTFTRLFVFMVSRSTFIFSAVVVFCTLHTLRVCQHMYTCHRAARTIYYINKLLASINCGKFLY